MWNFRFIFTPILAANPDDVIHENLLLEVKCSFSAHNRPIAHVTVSYILHCSNNEEGNELNSNH